MLLSARNAGPRARIGGVKEFTTLQGRYLAFIYIYTRIHGRPPAESELQRQFRVTPPAVHQMVLTLDRNGLISRTPGAARSIEVLVPPQELPLLEFLIPAADSVA
jgi:DNA-binding MarR family transcriptional regulator